VALGSGSLASTAGGIAGWVPVGADTTLANAVMNTMGTTGVFAVGNPAAGVYRQITGVAAGTTASDAVNVAQLQAAISSVNTSTTPTTDDRAVKYDGASGSPKDHVTGRHHVDRRRPDRWHHDQQRAPGRCVGQQHGCGQRRAVVPDQYPCR
jgi:autotransporter adhesin